jgi:hypothetical protein
MAAFDPFLKTELRQNTPQIVEFLHFDLMTRGASPPVYFQTWPWQIVAESGPAPERYCQIKLRRQPDGGVGQFLTSRNKRR